MANLNVNQNFIAIYSENFNCVFNINTNNLIQLKSAELPKSNLKYLGDPYLGLVRYCSAISNDGKWYAVAEERRLTIWSTSDWVQKSVKVLERSASRIIFTPMDNTILVADKTGDVYSFSVLDDSCSKGILLMGHLSILLDIIMTSNEKFIISSDRDEKIRVTNYPNTYNIERFCLDHSTFVTKLILLNNDILLSSSGDGFLKVWKFLEGKCILSYLVVDDIKDDLADVDAEQYIITNVATFNLNPNDIIVCVSVHKYNGILIYSCNPNLNFSMKILQKINCNEPLDFVVQEPLLWMLNICNSCCLNAFIWNDRTSNFENSTPCNINNSIRIINEKLLSSVECSHIDDDDNNNGDNNEEGIESATTNRDGSGGGGDDYDDEKRIIETISIIETINRVAETMIDLTCSINTLYITPIIKIKTTSLRYPKLKNSLRRIICEFYSRKMTMFSRLRQRLSPSSSSSSFHDQQHYQPHIEYPDSLLSGPLLKLTGMKMFAVANENCKKKTNKHSTVCVFNGNDTLDDVLSGQDRFVNQRHEYPKFIGYGNETELSVDSDKTFKVNRIHFEQCYKQMATLPFARYYYKFKDSIGNCEYVIRHDYNYYGGETKNLNVKYIYDTVLVKLCDNVVDQEDDNIAVIKAKRCAERVFDPSDFELIHYPLSANVLKIHNHYAVCPFYYVWNDDVQFVFRFVLRANLKKKKIVADTTQDDDNMLNCNVNIECENSKINIFYFYNVSTLLYLYLCWQLGKYHRIVDAVIDVESEPFEMFVNFAFFDGEQNAYRWAKKTYKRFRLLDHKALLSIEANLRDPNKIINDDDTLTLKNIGDFSQLRKIINILTKPNRMGPRFDYIKHDEVDDENDKKNADYEDYDHLDNETNFIANVCALGCIKV